LKLLAAKAEELTGYDAMTFRELVVDPSQFRRYPMFDWLYGRLGIFPWVVEIWNPEREAGIPPGFHPSGWLGGDHPVEDELTLLRWSDEALGGRGFVDWYPYDHPELGPVELGGWDKINYWYNPPFELLRREVEPLAEWVVFHALVTPRLELRTFEREELEPGLYRLRLVVQNAGWLPTSGTKKALEGYLVGPVEAELELPEGAELLAGAATAELGQLAGRVEQRSVATWWGYEPGTAELAAAEWIVRAAAGSEVRATARHVRAGTVRAATTL
jgi:hypothetical protein